MAKGSLSVMKLVSIALVVAGAGLAIWGYQLSNSVESSLSRAITGSETDKVMMMYIGAAVCVVVGVFLSRK